MIAKDIMTRDLITVAPTMTVKQLAMTLIKNQISGAPVAGKNGKLVGIVSENDIIAKKGKDVKAIMSKQIISVGEETSVEEIAQLMTARKIKRVPVMHGDAIVGIVSRADIVRMMASRWACGVCGAIQHGRMPTVCESCGADGSHFERELDLRPEVTQHQ